MNRRFLAPVLGAAALGGSLVACGPNHTTSAPLTFGPSDTAQASAAVSAASSLALKCQPKGENTQVWEVRMLTSKSVRAAFYQCEAIPPGDDDAVAACALTAAETAHKSTAATAAKETQFINALAACAQNLGASPSSAATATLTPTASVTVSQ